MIAGGGLLSPHRPVASVSKLRAAGRAQTAPFHLDKCVGKDKASGGFGGHGFARRTSLRRLRESTQGLPEEQRKDRSEILNHRALLVLNKSHHVTVPSLPLYVMHKAEG